MLERAGGAGATFVRSTEPESTQQHSSTAAQQLSTARQGRVPKEVYWAGWLRRGLACYGPFMGCKSLPTAVARQYCTVEHVSDIQRRDCRMERKPHLHPCRMKTVRHYRIQCSTVL